MHIREFVDEAHRAAKAAGWWNDTLTKYLIGTKFMLIVSEISEAMEGYRKNIPDDHLPHRPMVEVELADAMIRIADLAGRLGLDLEGAILEKMAYNANREDHKLENREKPNGKSF